VQFWARWKLLATGFLKRGNHFYAFPGCFPVYDIFLAVLSVEFRDVATGDVLDQVRNEPILGLMLAMSEIFVVEVPTLRSSP
jgi:hypothetical protein